MSLNMTDSLSSDISKRSKFNDCCCFCCHTLSLLPPAPSPSPSLSAALFLGSYPAEEQEKQTQQEVFTCPFVCFLSLWHMSAWMGMTLHNRVRGRISNRVCVSRLVTCMCSNMHTRELFTPQDWVSFCTEF